MGCPGLLEVCNFMRGDSTHINNSTNLPVIGTANRISAKIPGFLPKS